MKEMKEKSSYKIQIKSQITGSPYLSADYGKWGKCRKWGSYGKVWETCGMMIEKAENED